jgi:hypothetical protein
MSCVVNRRLFLLLKKGDIYSEYPSPSSSWSSSSSSSPCLLSSSSSSSSSSGTLRTNKAAAIMASAGTKQILLMPKCYARSECCNTESFCVRQGGARWTMVRGDGVLGPISRLEASAIEPRLTVQLGSTSGLLEQGTGLATDASFLLQSVCF